MLPLSISTDLCGTTHIAKHVLNRFCSPGPKYTGQICTCCGVWAIKLPVASNSLILDFISTKWFEPQSYTCMYVSMYTSFSELLPCICLTLCIITAWALRQGFQPSINLHSLAIMWKKVHKKCAVKKKNLGLAVLLWGHILKVFRTSVIQIDAW